MAVTYRIAAVGDWESVMGFRALGLDTYPVADAAEAREKVRETIERIINDGCSGLLCIIL